MLVKSDRSHEPEISAFRRWLLEEASGG